MGADVPRQQARCSSCAPQQFFSTQPAMAGQVARGLASVVLLLVSAATASADCTADIGELGEGIAQASTQILKVATTCRKWEKDRTDCSADVAAMVQALDAEQKDIAQALADCGGLGAACTASLQKLGDAVGQCGPHAASVAEACAPTKPKLTCIMDAILLAGDVTGLVADVAEAVRQCKKSTFVGVAEGSSLVLV